MVNRKKKDWLWETLQIADCVQTEKCSDFCATRHATVFTDGKATKHEEKKIDTKKEIVNIVVKTDGKSNDEWRRQQQRKHDELHNRNWTIFTERILDCMKETFLNKLNIWIIK